MVVVAVRCMAAGSRGGSNGTVVPWWVLVRARRPVQAFRWRNLKEKRLGFSHNNLLKFNH